VLRLPGRIADEIVTHLRAELPWEGCGLIAAVEAPGAVRQAMAFFLGANQDASSTRFTMDPAEVVAAFAAMERAGWMLGAIVHSHPHTSAIPSPIDRRESYYPEAITAIVSFATEPPIWRAWWMAEQEPIEVPIERCR
jgi:proteasome lid subunit RPN8/RPN11